MVMKLILFSILCRFNREGDFLITCGKDSLINLWFSDNGERAGTFNGHNGAVWTTDVNCKSIFILIINSLIKYLTHTTPNNTNKQMIAPFCSLVLVILVAVFGTCPTAKNSSNSNSTSHAAPSNSTLVNLWLLSPQIPL